MQIIAVGVPLGLGTVVGLLQAKATIEWYVCCLQLVAECLLCHNW